MIAQLDLFAAPPAPPPPAPPVARATVPAPAPVASSPDGGTNDGAVTIHFSDDRTATILEDAPATPRYREELERVAVDPKRLDKGGDIDKSYSADLICYESKLRSTFRLNGAEWVNTGGLWWAGGRYCECYRVVPAETFDVPTSTYQTHDWNRARETSGYHGMKVKSGGREVVLVGPSIVIIAGEVEQGALL